MCAFDCVLLGWMFVCVLGCECMDNKGVLVCVCVCVCVCVFVSACELVTVGEREKERES